MGRRAAKMPVVADAGAPYIGRVMVAASWTNAASATRVRIPRRRAVSLIAGLVMVAVAVSYPSPQRG